MNLAGLDRALRALGPYVEDVVLCGAWAWYVHRRCSGSATWLPMEFTRDVDCVGRETLALRGSAPLQAYLEAQEFVWAPRGDENPPVALFAWPSIASPEVEIEFLAPARGDGSVRVVELQKGVTAQTLRDVDILLDEPVRVRMDDSSPLALELPYRGTFQIPKVGHFCIQKALIHRRRNVEQQVKDVFYVFDLINSVNGMSAAVLSDVLAAERRWGAGVSALVELLHQRATEPRFLKALAEQFPEERGSPFGGPFLHEDRMKWGNLSRIMQSQQGDHLQQLAAGRWAPRAARQGVGTKGHRSALRSSGRARAVA